MTAIAQLSESFGIADDDSLDKVEQEFFSASLIPQSEWPSLIEILAQGAKSDKGIVDSLAAIREASGRERIDHYLRIFCTAELSPRKSLMTKALADRHPEWLARLLDEQDAYLRAARPRTRAQCARTHARADHHRQGSDRPLSPRKRATRAARLRRPDRPHAGAVQERLGRLGALQARSRHRPYSDRRGAGHQSEAVGDHQDS